MNRLLTFSLLAILMSFAVSSCKEEGCTDPEADNYNRNAFIDDGSCSYLDTLPEPEDPPKSVPSSYDFKDANYQKARDLITHLDAIDALLDSAEKVNGAIFDQATFTAMLGNTGDNGGGAFPFNSPWSILNNLSDTTKDLIVNVLAPAYTAATASAAVAANLQPGNMQTLDGRFIYNLDAAGFSDNHVIDKLIMGGCFLHQASNMHLDIDSFGDMINGRDIAGNKVDKKQQYRQMDMIFGYFGIPPTFSSNTNGTRFWGEDCNNVDAIANTNGIGLDFREARTAILNNDLTVRKAEVESIMRTWETVYLSKIAHWLNIAAVHQETTGTQDLARKSIALSHALGYIYCIRENKFSSVGLDRFYAAISLMSPPPPAPPVPNAWFVNNAPQINSIRDTLLEGTSIYPVRESF